MDKIAITGPESTGKSRLARELANHYRDVFVPEFAREYIDKLQRPYTESDILHIAKNQLKLESDLAPGARRFLFCDTELIVAKIWSLHKYGRCDPYILQQIEKNSYSLYLLCDIDLPWQADEQREHPHLRKYFFNWYQRELEDYGFPYVIVSGPGRQRLQGAAEALNDRFPQ
ncbi:MAG: ATP-binding protein [Bacteroidales bacterium]